MADGSGRLASAFIVTSAVYIFAIPAMLVLALTAYSRHVNNRDSTSLKWLKPTTTVAQGLLIVSFFGYIIIRWLEVNYGSPGPSLFG